MMWPSRKALFSALQAKSPTEFCGTADFSIEGETPNAKADELKVCQILTEQMNRDGAHWGNLQKPPREEAVDYEARDGKKVLKIQVTLAEGDTKFWKELKQAGRKAGKMTMIQASDALKAAVIHKSKRASKDVVLALDAINARGMPLVPWWIRSAPATDNGQLRLASRKSGL